MARPRRSGLAQARADRASSVLLTTHRVIVLNTLTSVQVPAGVTWVVLAFKTELTTSANVANRLPNLNHSPTAGVGANVFWYVPGLASTAASLTRAYVWARGITAQVVDTAQDIYASAFPMLPLLGGTFLVLQTNNLQAGDGYNSGRVSVLETSWRTVAEAELLASQGGIIAEPPGLELAL